MRRCVIVIASFQLACLQTEPVDLTTDMSDVAELLDDASVDAVGLPSIVASPNRLTFRADEALPAATYTLNILSRGTSAIVVHGITLSDTANGQFSIADVETPLTLEPGQALALSVTFQATHVGPDVSSSLVIRSNAPQGDLVVPLEGLFDPGSECPVAVIGVAQGAEVTPETTLALDGAQSDSPNGTIVSYAWTVVQPDGSVGRFFPSAAAAAPTFEATVSGEYTFGLSVTDDNGDRSCVPAEYKVVASGSEPIRVELLWHTPQDRDESDSDGSDVDLHFLHPLAAAYADDPYDCFWDNHTPDWGALGEANDPRLERDDTDGAGPEILVVREPEIGARYLVSAHYYDDKGFGSAAVTVRVYIRGVLVDAWSDVALDALDRWDSFYIDWPSGIVTRIGTEPDIRVEYRPDYVH